MAAKDSSLARSPIVVSIMVTVQPILATAIQVLVLRAGAWPPPLSLLGYLVLAAGSLCVCWASGSEGAHAVR